MNRVSSPEVPVAYRRRAKRPGKAKEKVAVARELPGRIYHPLKRGTDYWERGTPAQAA